MHQQNSAVPTNPRGSPQTQAKFPRSALLFSRAPIGPLPPFRVYICDLRWSPRPSTKHVAVSRCEAGKGRCGAAIAKAQKEKERRQSAYKYENLG
jgi:hypothetical protein